MAPMGEKTLILLHGWGMNPAVFEPLQRALGARVRVSAPPLPGYPRSGWPQAADFSRQVEAMAQTLPAGRLLGWSLGGIYALELALRYPARFEDLTLIACNPCFVARPGWSCAIDESIFDEFGAGLVRDRQRTLKRFIALQLDGEPAARELARGLWRSVDAAGKPAAGVLRFGLDLLKVADYRRRLAELALPARWILGERDRLVPIALAQQIADFNVDIRVESVAGAAHAPFLSHSGQIAAYLQAPRGCR